ncbi:unnamed protein product [Eruca vesicaria subsp. sativa]|uniref:Uncharacterized protein n=1 Tax=Eruca vesicaria subsp. sativa TaxID=29727 RepID=A0ABC8LN46_ERUVS|nr:unnamed protein product [Eruca vesicaria subsp. sativa]
MFLSKTTFKWRIGDLTYLSWNRIRGGGRWTKALYFICIRTQEAGDDAEAMEEDEMVVNEPEVEKKREQKPGPAPEYDECDVRCLMKAAPPKEEPQAYIDCRGNLQIWRVNGQEKILLQAADHSKFYRGDCYVFQYSYPEEEKEEILTGTWFGKQSVEEERASAVSMASKMAESMKFVPAQARIYEGKEPLQFFVIMQSFIVFKEPFNSDNHLINISMLLHH